MTVSETWANDRQAGEGDPVERARRRALHDRDYARDLGLLAGVLAAGRYGPADDGQVAGRPVTDISVEWLT